MNEEINYKNNPLNGVGLKKMLTELHDHYGFDILFAYLNINCFKNNPSIISSVKFLKKTVWAREKVEGFYLYTFKGLPKASYQQSKLPPRDRIIPNDQTVGKPAVLDLADAKQLQEERELKAIEFEAKSGLGNRIKHTSTQDNPPSGYMKQGQDSERIQKKPASRKRVPSTAENPWGIPKD